MNTNTTTTEASTVTRRILRKLLASILTAGSLLGVSLALAPAAHASGATVKWKGDCEVVAWPPYRDSAGRVVVPAQFKCGSKHYVEHTENYLMTDKSWAPDDVAALKAWTHFWAAEDTWYNLTYTTCPRTGATRHVSAGLQVSGWSSTLVADSDRSYVFC